MLCLCYSSWGQQEPMYTQYMFNPMLINPGYAGTHDKTSFTAMTRAQWVGMNGAPTTHTFSVHSPMEDLVNSLGGTLIYDRIGANTQVGIYGAYARKVVFSKSTLSLGLQAGVSNYQFDANSVVLQSNNDPNFVSDNRAGILPNFGFGAFYYGQNWYASFSIPKIINSPIGKNVSGSFDRHYFIGGGYVFNVSEQIQLKPNFLMKQVTGVPFQVDLNLNARINEMFWVGFSYRTKESLDLLLEFMPNKKWRIGYSYDLITNSLNSYNSGTHEIMVNIRARFKKEIKKEEEHTPRLF